MTKEEFDSNFHQNTDICNPGNTGFHVSQSRDYGISKRAGIPGSGIPGLHSLVVTFGHIGINKNNIYRIVIY